MPDRRAISRVGYLCFCVLALNTLLVFTSFTQPRISHKPLLTATQQQELEFTAVVTDTIEVTNVELYYRTSGTGAFSWLRMAGNGNYYSIRLPRQFVTLAGLDYYIVARDRIGRSATSPATAPTEYFEIMVRQDDTSPLVLSRYPDDGDTVATAWPVIRIGFYEESSIDTRRTRVFLDSVDVTGTAHILVTNVSFTPTDALAPGMHHVRIIVPDGSGNIARDASWSFVVKPASTTRNPLKLQLTPSVSYAWSESRPVISDARSYGADLGINATQQVGEFTLSAHTSIHTDQALFSLHGRKTAKLQNLAISVSELPFSILWGNFSESFSELGMSNVSLKGIEGDVSFGSTKTKGFSGTASTLSGTTKRFQGVHSRVTLQDGTSFTGFIFSGKDLEEAASAALTGFKPVHGTVMGIGSSLAFIPGSQLSFELARSDNNISDVVHSADDVGYAGTFTGGTSVLGVNLSTQVQYVDHSFHNPGNLFLQPNCLSANTSASASIVSFLSASAQVAYTRRGLNADTATVPTDESTAGIQFSFTPLRVWNFSASVSRSEQKSDLQTVTSKNAEIVQAGLSSSLYLNDFSLSGGYSYTETEDRTIQQQSSHQHAATMSGSYRAGTYFSCFANGYYSNSTPIASGIATDCFTASFSSTTLLDASGATAVSMSATYNESLTSDHRSHTRSTSFQILLNSNFGLTMISPPRVQCLVGWSENKDLAGGASTTHQLQFNLSISWNLNLTL